jgi:lipopolysaccharide heptosyltransferase I
MSGEGSPRILISRLSPIGDTILTLPVACALREHFPDAFIAWVVEKPAAQIVCGHKALDLVIELEPRWHKTLSGIRSARQQLACHAFDTSIDCQGDTKSAFAAQLSRAQRRIGFAAPHSRHVSRLANNIRVTPVFPHLTDRSLELLTPLGIHTPRVQWNLPLKRESRLWASRWRRTIPQSRVAVLNPGATWPSKQWEPNRYGATAKYLREQYGYASVVVWGNVQELHWARAIAASADGATVLAPQTDLQHLAALIETSDLFISGDTGPMHLAVAVGTSTVGLYGATLPGMSGPYGQIAVQQAYEKGSERHRRKADNRAMQAITVQHVCDAVDELESRRELMNVAA